MRDICNAVHIFIYISHHIISYDEKTRSQGYIYINLYIYNRDKGREDTI